MDKLDKLVEKAMREEDRHIVAQTQELGYFSAAFHLFQGRLAWVAWVIMITQAILFVVGVWCAVHFFGAADVLGALKWGISGAVLILSAFMMKLSFMPQMQANRVLRELKRVELMLATRG